ncbi:unnamed protein product [Rotaria sp. Silwood2]|nr:unnamed protein product [Rotaria sp. Silwood2]
MLVFFAHLSSYTKNKSQSAKFNIRTSLRPMTLKDFYAKRSISYQPESSHQSSTSETNEQNHHLSHASTNPKLRRIRTSFFNLIHSHRSANGIENKTIHQQQESLTRRSSFIKSSDIAPSLEKKTVAFASVFDEPTNEYDEDHLDSNLESNINDETVSEKDLVTVISNKENDDEIPTDPNKNIEPYPFRSEIQLPSSTQSNSVVGDTTTHHRHSRKDIIDRFIHHHRTKKLHTNPTVKYISSTNRSNSTPDIMISSSSSATPTKVKTRDPRRPLQAIRAWLKSLSLRSSTPAVHKHPQENDSSKHQKPQIARRSIGLRRFSELQY